jgi:hypothetical protein
LSDVDSKPSTKGRPGLSLRVLAEWQTMRGTWAVPYPVASLQPVFAEGCLYDLDEHSCCFDCTRAYPVEVFVIMNSVVLVINGFLPGLLEERLSPG